MGNPDKAGMACKWQIEIIGEQLFPSSPGYDSIRRAPQLWFARFLLSKKEGCFTNLLRISQ